MACAYPENNHPDDEDENPYTPEVQNGIRLSALLINEGTKAVRNRFIEKLRERNFKSVAEALQDKKIRAKIESLYKGAKGKPKLLNDNQYHLLFPKKGKPNWDNFDLTLLTLLLRQMLNLPPPMSTNNWKDNPDDKDTGFCADLVRIRHMRNEIYGHISHMGLPDCEFKILWANLETVLLRLGSKQKQIDVWKTKTLAEDTRDEYLKQMTVLFESDLSDMQNLVKIVGKSLSANKQFYEEHVEHLEEVIGELSTKSSFGFQELDFKFAKVLQLLSELPGDIAGVILRNIDSKHFDVMKEMKEVKTLIKDHSVQLQKLQETSDLIKESLDTEKDLVMPMVSEIRQQNTDILNNIKKLCQEAKADLSKHESIQQIQHRIKQNSSAFRILLFNKPTSLQSTFQDVKNEFCYALGSVPWDIIFDLDHDSRRDGIFDDIARVLNKKKDFKVVTYDEVDRLSEDDKENIASSVKTLWFLANGSSDIGCKEVDDENVGVLVFKLFPLFETIIRKLQSPRPLLLIGVIMSETMKEHMSEFVKTFSFVCQGMRDRILFEESAVLSVYLEDSQASYVPNSESGIQHCRSNATPLQFMSVLSECFQFEHLDKTFSYPGKNVTCYISPEDMAQLQPYVELYHSDIGKINFDGKSEDEIEEVVDGIKHRFLKGYVLTPEAMFLHEKFGQVYVARKEMIDVKNMIEKSLEEKEQWLPIDDRVFQGKYEILHDSCGSGSTTGIFLLYLLRCKYPCLSIKKIARKTVELLKNISRESNKPLLLVVDSEEYKPADVSSFHNELQNKRIKSLVVHVRRLASSDQEYRNNQEDSPAMKNKCYLSSKLHNEEDKVSFKKLYETVQNKIRADRVYLFGLIAFCEDYARLDSHVEGCLENMTDDEINILSLVFMIWKLCHRTVRVSLLYNLLRRKIKNVALVDVLGAGCDLVIQEGKLQSSVRPAHQCLLDPFQKMLSKNHTQAVIMETFMNNLYKMFSFSNSSKEDSLQLCHHLFIQRENPREEFFTPMVTKLSKVCGEDFVATQMMKFINLYQGITKENHLRGLYARYLMYKLKNSEEALKQIKIAVDITAVESRSAVLLNTYGQLFRYYGTELFDRKRKEDNGKKALEESVQYFEESVHGFKLAQSITQTFSDSVSSYISKYTPHAFIGEAKSRYQLLKLCFIHVCRRKHDLFHLFIKDCKITFIVESEKEAMDALDKIDNLISIDRLHDEEPIFTKQTMQGIKFKLLLLRYDESTTVSGLLKQIPKDVPCDVGTLVRFSIKTLSYDPGNMNKKRWKDLTVDELKLIIDTILQRSTARSMLSCNYSAVLYAMIHLRHVDRTGRYKRYNIDLALHLAREWVEMSRNNVNSLYMLSAILVAKALEKNDRDVTEEAVVILQKCREQCKKNPSAKALRNSRFAIGIGAGLEKLVPINLINLESSENLQEFHGRMMEKDLIAIYPFNGVLKAKVTNADLAKNDQKPVLKFNLHVQKLNSLLAVNIEQANAESLNDEF